MYAAIFLFRFFHFTFYKKYYTKTEKQKNENKTDKEQQCNPFTAPDTRCIVHCIKVVKLYRTAKCRHGK